MLAAGFWIPRDADPLVLAAMRARLEAQHEAEVTEEAQSQADELLHKLKGARR